VIVEPIIHFLEAMKMVENEGLFINPDMPPILTDSVVRNIPRG
jgi:hypothetical protein